MIKEPALMSLNDYDRSFKQALQNREGYHQREQLKPFIEGHVRRMLELAVEDVVLPEEFLIAFDWACYSAIHAFKGEPDKQLYYVDLSIKRAHALDSPVFIAEAWMNKCILTKEARQLEEFGAAVESLKKAVMDPRIIGSSLNHLHSYVKSMVGNSLYAQHQQAQEVAEMLNGFGLDTPLAEIAPQPTMTTLYDREVAKAEKLRREMADMLSMFSASVRI